MKDFKIINIIASLSDIKDNPKILTALDIFKWRLDDKDFNEGSIQESISKLKKSKQEIGVVCCSLKQIESVESFAKFLYIPGYLCRQTDILIKASQTQLPLFIEKGNFLAPNDISRLLNKVSHNKISIVETGSSFGYSDNILDLRSLYILKENAIIFGVNLSSLYGKKSKTYPHKAKWTNSYNFYEAFILGSQALGASFFVIDNQKNLHTISEDKVLEMQNAFSVEQNYV